MINRQLLKLKVENMTDSEVVEVLEYISIMESLNEQANSTDPLEEAILGLLLQAMREEQTSPSQLLRQRRALAN
jgi:hypothetical protein